MKKLLYFILVFSWIAAKSQIINFPDANFKAKLLTASVNNTVAKNSSGANIVIDNNNDGEIQISEALNVFKLDVSNANISDVTGVENFTNLTELGVYNNQITALNLAGLNNLITLSASYNNLTSINDVGTSSIQYLRIWNNQITEIDVTNWPNLKGLSCFSNLLTSLIISDMEGFESLSCELNNLTNLTLQNLPNLISVNAGSNQIASINLSNLNSLDSLVLNNNQLSAIEFNDFPNLVGIDIRYNFFTSVDTSSLFNLTILKCDGNPSLENIYSKNGRNETILFYSCPSLKYMCLDEVQLTDVQSYINLYGLTNCFISTYCSFSPGGIYYTIEGNNKLDNNANGCDVNDLIVPNLRYSITTPFVNSGTLVSNNSGTYRIPVTSGNYTITPMLDYPSYFNVSPANVNVNFPSQSSPFQQNFCIIPNGFHPDLEVVMMPFLSARPGFDAYYTVILRNNGNITQSGSLQLNFDDAILDYVHSFPVISSLTINNLSWNFTNLEPLHSIAFGVVFNLNSPLEVPAINNGDILHYTANVNTSNADDTPSDNTSILNQQVVNSFDPNDKTCIEGTVVSSDMVGKYVHYIIRFENTGTANAQNIVVKDIIDTTKFNINTLVPLFGSHSYTTKINNNNKVEFIFENINLPFDDASNDGYVAFKIKTKPTLVVGDTFSNSANIYFDYNFPITTNTYSTTIQTLSNQDFVFDDVFTLSPVPAKDILNITSKKEILISSLTFYNVLGQIVQIVTSPKNSIDISGLEKGNYFIKINTNRGSSTKKFTKE